MEYMQKRLNKAWLSPMNQTLRNIKSKKKKIHLMTLCDKTLI